MAKTKPKLELVDVEVSPDRTEKRCKATVIVPNHVEYSSKEQLTKLKEELTTKLDEINRRLAVFPK